MSSVTYQMSRVKCQLSGVTVTFFDTMLDLVSGGSVINKAYPVLFYSVPAVCLAIRVANALNSH